MQLNKLFFVQTLLLLLLPLANMAHAEEQNWYQVEIIVFNRDNQAHSELEKAITPPHMRKPPIELIRQTEQNSLDNLAYSELPEEALQLNNEIGKLLQAKHYEVLLHTGWRQPIDSSKVTRPIHIIGGEQLFLGEPEDESEDDYYRWQIDGLLWLKKNRGYINVDLNMLFNQPIAEGDVLASNDIPIYRVLTAQIMQQQRARQNTLLYFDHPHYGVLVKFFPVKKEVLPQNPSISNNPTPVAMQHLLH